ncbi:MAG: VWA domain-containing protein [Cyanobacteriota bacterium]|nr:VWA domain-containing protein [Cyanobacteriota bacterium]
MTTFTGKGTLFVVVYANLLILIIIFQQKLSCPILKNKVDMMKSKNITPNPILPVKFLVSFLPLLLLISCGDRPETLSENLAENKAETSSTPPPPQASENWRALPPQQLSKPTFSRRRLSNRTADIAVQQSVPTSMAESQIDSSLEPTSNTEEYNLINDNPFKVAKNNPLSTFSIDVDTASYSNLRRFISEGKLPPKDAVRIEELINYFTYDYPQPEANNPFSITTEISDSPWNNQHKLVHIGIQGKDIVTENLPSSNLVFLLDVSGSMNTPNKLPLIKSAFQLLVDELTEKDTVSIVVYAGAAGVVLPPTKGSEKDKILAAINNLEAGGSTAGGEGIKLAYDLAKRFYQSSGNNRVILATDGDFNVGVSSDAELVRTIENYRDEGIFLTVLGFGTGNFKDAKMEQLANKGNGNYAYIDHLLEAKKVLVTEMGGTLLTIAKDMKIQVEFNPAKVQAYRLIGYENRLLRSQDFNDDTKDAGELGAGHSVTALYEVIPVGVESNVKLPEVDELRYQDNQVEEAAYNSDELMLVKLRYKEPKGTNSELIKQPVVDKGVSLDEASNDFKFAAAVAEYGMILRDSEYKGDASFNEVWKLANESKGLDLEGYRSEFINMVKSSQKLMEKK